MRQTALILTLLTAAIALGACEGPPSVRGGVVRPSPSPLPTGPFSYMVAPLTIPQDDLTVETYDSRDFRHRVQANVFAVSVPFAQLDALCAKHRLVKRGSVSLPGMADAFKVEIIIDVTEDLDELNVLGEQFHPGERFQFDRPAGAHLMLRVLRVKADKASGVLDARLLPAQRTGVGTVPSPSPNP